MERYLIKTINDDGFTCFIDDVVLEGDLEDLYNKMQHMDYVISLGIHESFFFNLFCLVPENEIDFPEYVI